MTYLVFRADLHLQVQIYNRLFNLVLVAVLSARSLVARGRRSVVVAARSAGVTAVAARLLGASLTRVVLGAAPAVRPS